MASVETVVMFGKKGRVIVNKTEQEAWAAKGYKLKLEAKQDDAGGNTSVNTTGDNYEDYTVAELKVMAEEAGIEVYKTMPKAKIIEALRAIPAKQDDEGGNTAQV